MNAFMRVAELSAEIGRAAIIKKIKEECKRLKKSGDNNAEVASLVLNAVGIIESGNAEDSAQSLVDMNSSKQEDQTND